MLIMIRVEGAQPEGIVRGLFAAQEVFDQAGYHARSGGDGAFCRRAA